MSALEERPEVEEKPKNLPSTAFDSETGSEAVAEREKQRNARKMGVAARIREMVGNDPARIANILFDILENVSGTERSADRISAAKELFDRGWGKAPAYAPIEGGDPLEASDLDKAIAEIAAQLTARKAHPELEASVVRPEEPGP